MSEYCRFQTPPMTAETHVLPPEPEPKRLRQGGDGAWSIFLIPYQGL